MKLMKKIATMLLCVCLAVPCFAMVSHAENNAIRFNDPSTKVGETVEIKVNVQAQSSVQTIDITFSFDTSMLKFVGGEHAIETESGTVQYKNALNWASLADAYYFSLKFEALKAGTTKIEVKSENISTGTEINWIKGSSKVTIAAGDGTTPTEPDTTDTPSEDVEEPDVSEDGTPEISISDSTSITLEMDVTNVILPERYVETSVTVEGEEYPAWQDSLNSDMYIMYATSSNGDTSLYQYDTLENTYQRFEAPEVEEEDTSLMGKVMKVFGDKLDYLVFGACGLFLLLIIILIVVSVKLYNRNAELDELYDEYGIDLDEEEEKKPVNKPVKKYDDDDDDYETEDDVVLIADDEEEETELEETSEKSPETEAELLVQESLKEFFEEEEAEKNVKQKAEEDDEDSDEYYDDDEDVYDDLESSFTVDFIDLDD